MRGQIRIREAVGSSKAIFDQGFRVTVGECLWLIGNPVSEFPVIIEFRAFMEGATGVDGPVFAPADGLGVGFGRPPFAGGVEVLQSEADGVDLPVALGALGLLLVRGEAFARGENLVF